MYSQVLVACSFFAYMALNCGIWKAMKQVLDIFHGQNPCFNPILTVCDGGTKNRNHGDLLCKHE